MGFLIMSKDRGASSGRTNEEPGRANAIIPGDTVLFVT